jgi:methylenetetrahydrofolate reductase (NADPH)
MRYVNVLRQRLAQRQFVASIEFVTPESREAFEAAIAPIIDLASRIKLDARIDTISLTDRVRSDDDHDPVRVAAHVAEACGKAPTVHLSGKDRDPAHLAAALAGMHDAGLENVLLVTGDRVKSEPARGRVRYHESVAMIAEARGAGAFHVAAAVSPFKYREEEAMGQYLKMAKKERAGADAFITQVGWDMLKLKELAAYRRRRGLTAPVMVGVMLLTAARARYIRSHSLAGIVVSDGLMAKLEEEAKQPDKGVSAAYRRLALQIVGIKRLGFAGFQLTGLHAFDKLDALFRQVDGLDRGLQHEGAWWDAWWHALRGNDGRPVALAPRPFYLFDELAEPDGWSVPVEGLTPRRFDATPGDSTDLRAYERLERLHRVLFEDGSPGAAILARLMRLVPRGSSSEQVLHRLERLVKHAAVGCETCGFCRLPYAFYVCPEVCPKGLANGPCGGTNDNTCESGDRECAHNRRYRVAKQAGRLTDLERFVIPPVPADVRGTCSWTSHFRGDDPMVLDLDSLDRPHREAPS